MVAALHQDLRPAKVDRFLNLLVDFLVGDHVGVLRLLTAPEIAELAVDIADVGVVDVAIYHVGDDVVAAAVVGVLLGQLTTSICERTEVLQGQAIESLGLVEIDALAVPNPLLQFVK